MNSGPQAGGLGQAPQAPGRPALLVAAGTAISRISSVVAMANTPSDSARIRPMPSSAASSSSCRGSFHTRSGSLLTGSPAWVRRPGLLLGDVGEAGVVTAAGGPGPAAHSRMIARGSGQSGS
jgi:hypothetical protein